VSPGRRDNLFTPVGPLHRTQGSFDDANESAAVFSGDAARAAVVACGAALFFAIGYFAAAKADRSSRISRRRAQSGTD